MLIKFLFIMAIVWWLVFFMVLPFGINVPKKQERGNADSAPEKPRLELKVLITTIISTIITWGIIYIIYSGVINLDSL